MRDDAGGVVMAATFHPLIERRWPARWSRRWRMWETWSGEGPVPGVRCHRGGRHYFRRPKSMMERRQAAFVAKEEGEVAPRGARSCCNLPNAYDDYCVASRDDRSWKRVSPHPVEAALKEKSGKDSSCRPFCFSPGVSAGYSPSTPGQTYPYSRARRMWARRSTRTSREHASRRRSMRAKAYRSSSRAPGAAPLQYRRYQSKRLPRSGSLSQLATHNQGNERAGDYALWSSDFTSDSDTALMRQISACIFELSMTACSVRMCSRR